MYDSGLPMTVGSPVSPLAAPELTLSQTSQDMSVNLTHSAPTNDQGHTQYIPELYFVITVQVSQRISKNLFRNVTHCTVTCF